MNYKLKDYNQILIQYMYDNSEFALSDIRRILFGRTPDMEHDEYLFHYNHASNTWDMILKQGLIVFTRDTLYKLEDSFRKDLISVNGDYNNYLLKKNFERIKEKNKEIRKVKQDRFLVRVALVGLILQIIFFLYEHFFDKPVHELQVQSTDSLLRENLKVLKSIDSSFKK